MNTLISFLSSLITFTFAAMVFDQYLNRRRPYQLVWTLAPQVLIGLGLGLSVDSLTVAALTDRSPRALHGGWTIAARHAGVVAGLAILTPIFTADLRHAGQEFADQDMPGGQVGGH